MSHGALSSALARLERGLRTPSLMEPRWRERYGLDDDESLVVRVGAPDPAALARADEVAREAFGRPLPPSLRQLLGRWNGVAIDGVPLDAARGEQPEVVPPESLDEPVLWPLRGYDDPFSLASDEVRGLSMPYVLGELSESGLVVLDLDVPEGVEAPLLWVDSEMSPPTARRIAADLAEFLDRWCDAQLILPSVLEATAIPGWQWSRK